MYSPLPWGSHGDLKVGLGLGLVLRDAGPSTTGVVTGISGKWKDFATFFPVALDFNLAILESSEGETTLLPPLSPVK